MNTSITKKTLVLHKKKPYEKETGRSLKNENTALKITVWLTVFTASGYLLTHPSLSNKTVGDALLFCFKTLIPSLFPFMIAGEILVSSGFPSVCERYLGKIFYRVFGVSGKGAAAFVIGAFCGFPVGAKTAVSLFLSGDIEKKDAERLSGICNNGGVGFLISGIGAGIWHSTAFGVALYLSQLVSAVIAGFLLFGARKKSKDSIASSTSRVTPEKDFSLAEALSNAVSSSVLSMLRVIGFVVFFEVALSMLSEVLVLAGADLFVISLISAFAEITAGAKSLSLLSLLPSFYWTYAAKILTFSLSAWGGLSVYMQFCAFAYPSGVGTKTYLKSKLAQSAICTVIGAILVLLKAV